MRDRGYVHESLQSIWRLKTKKFVDIICDCVRVTPPQLQASSGAALTGSRKRLLTSDLSTAVALRSTCQASLQQERPSYYGPLKVCKVTNFHPPRDRIEQVEREVCKLEGQFGDLVGKTTSVVKQSMAKTDLATFREEFICRLLSIDSAKKPLHGMFLKNEIQKAESVELIIRSLSFYWNFINSDLLEHIIKTNFADNADLQQGLRSYLTAKCTFCQTTTVCEFEAAKTRLPVVLPKFEIPPDFSVVVLQVLEEWTDYTIAQALATWQHIAEDIQVRKILGFFTGGSSSNSVNLVWAVAPDIVSVVAEALTSQQVRERNAIKAVCIDGKLLEVQMTEQEVSTVYTS